MILDIITKENPILRTPTENVNVSEDGLTDLVYNMMMTVKAMDGAGLAAPQIGVSKKIIVVKDVNNKIGDFFEMINPEIVWTSFDKQYEPEGCLSIPDDKGGYIHERVTRYKRIRVKWEDLEGNKHEELIKNPLQSRIIQHEIDHLNGILFVDYLK